MRNFKKVGAIALAAAMGLSVAACGSSSDSTSTSSNSSSETSTSSSSAVDSSSTSSSSELADISGEINVFAAASMTETLNEIKDDFEELYPDVTINLTLDSSGTLEDQIKEGAECDLFISAAQKQMNEIDAEDTTGSNTDGLDLVDSETRVDLLENKVVLVTPEENPAELAGFADLKTAFDKDDFIFCMGNSDVPVGQYTQKILSYYNLDETSLASAGKITYGTNVKEVTTQVSEGSVQAGVVYATDAYSAGLTALDEATADMCGQVIYPAAVLKGAANADAAQIFLDYLQSDEAMEIFEGVGFSAVK